MVRMGSSGCSAAGIVETTELEITETALAGTT
jgi:hypothetical protein